MRARLLLAKSEDVRMGAPGISPGLNLLAIGLEPMVDQPLRRM
jgi:hypothetical protein